MAFSETKIVIGGLAHVPVLIFLANFIKVRFEGKTQQVKDSVFKEEPVKIIEVKETAIKEEPVKIIEVKGTAIKEEKAEAIEELSNKLDNIEQKADEVYAKVKKKKKDKKKKKKNMKRD